MSDYSHLDHVTFDWTYSVYGDSDEALPSIMPTPRGNPVCITTFEDANVMHDLTTGRSCTEILHLVDQTPVEWFSKRQKTTETATYGSKFVAACIATEQIKWTFGILYGGWEFLLMARLICLVITKAWLPAAPFLILPWPNANKNALAYHGAGEAITSDVI
jgi:hypothetical protein